MSGSTDAVSAGPNETSATGTAQHGSGSDNSRPGWPLESSLVLAAQPTAPARARGHVRAIVEEWGLPQLADTAELLASELVTNSVLAYKRAESRADPVFVPVVGLCLVSDRLSLVLQVWDACDDMPVRQDPQPGEIGGRGLLLVETLGKDWGACPEAGGKVVWVQIGPSDDL